MEWRLSSHSSIQTGSPYQWLGRPLSLNGWMFAQKFAGVVKVFVAMIAAAAAAARHYWKCTWAEWEGTGGEEWREGAGEKASK